MGKEFTITVTGTEQVLATLKALGEQAGPAMQAALYEEGHLLLADSQALVPVDQGTLKGSGTVQVEEGANRPTVIVGYGGAAADYALSVHENPRSGKTGGVSPSGKKYKHWAQVGEWKYLETPFKARVAGFDDRIAATLKDRLLKGG
jgi:hypothetical protein